MERSCGDLIPALSFYCMQGKSLGEDFQQYVGACQGHTDSFRNSWAPKYISKYVLRLVPRSTILNLSVMRSYWMPAGTPPCGMELWLSPGHLRGKWQKLCSSGKLNSSETFPSLTSKRSHSARAQPSCSNRKKPTCQFFFTCPNMDLPFPPFPPLPLPNYSGLLSRFDTGQPRDRFSTHPHVSW